MFLFFDAFTFFTIESSEKEDEVHTTGDKICNEFNARCFSNRIVVYSNTHPHFGTDTSYLIEGKRVAYIDKDRSIWTASGAMGHEMFRFVKGGDKGDHMRTACTDYRIKQDSGFFMREATEEERRQTLKAFLEGKGVFSHHKDASSKDESTMNIMIALKRGMHVLGAVRKPWMDYDGNYRKELLDAD